MKSIKSIVLLVIATVSVNIYAWTPDKPIVVTSAYSAGSSNEQVFRKLSGVVMNNNPGVHFIIEPRPGGDGVVANNHVLAQKSDGYSIGIPTVPTTFVTNDIWQSDIKKYSWDTFITPVIMGETPIAIVASTQSPVSSFNEFVTLLKTSNRNINIGTAGGTQSLTYEYLLLTTTTKDSIAKIQYNTSAQTALAVISNQLEFGIVAPFTAIPLAQENKLKIIAVTSELINSNITTTQSIIPGFKLPTGYMIILPPGTPNDVVQWYEREFKKAMGSSEYQQWATDNYITVNTNLTNDRAVKLYARKMRDNMKHIINLVNKNVSSTK